MEEETYFADGYAQDEQGEVQGIKAPFGMGFSGGHRHGL
jgi:hypothetical protein